MASLSGADLDACLGPLDRYLGVRLIEASDQQVVAEVTLAAARRWPRQREAVLHPGGIVDGGVYATLSELVASVGANPRARSRGRGGRR